MDFVCSVYFVISLFLFSLKNSPVIHGLGGAVDHVPFSSQLLRAGHVPQIGPIIVPCSPDTNWFRGGHEPEPCAVLLEPGGKAVFSLRGL